MKRLLEWVKAHRKKALAIGLALVVVLAATGYFGYNFLKQSDFVKRNNSKTATKNTEPAKPITKPSPLTGVEVAPELADRPVTAVVIENHPDARPQSGLGEAGVVYEALAEGGITRFLAFFLENRPAQLGPIRSLRTYFVDWALEFDAPVVHVGGNAAALDLIGPLGMKDINEFAYGSYFFRSRDRFAPHNAYITSDQLDTLERALGFDKPATFKPSPRKKDEPPTGEVVAAHPTINVNYSYNGFQAAFQYDPAANNYTRTLAGAPHIERNNGQQIRVKNIVVEFMPTSYGVSRIGEQMTIMATPGSGRAIVFRDGGAVEGTWSKATHRERTKLLDANGAEIPLNAGNTWYCIVPTDKTVTY